MRRVIGFLAMAAAFAPWVLTSSVLAVVIGRSVVTDGDSLAGRVAVQNVRVQGSTIMGDLVNRTDRNVSDIRLVVADSFRWADEFHPGGDDPSRATSLTIPGPLGPNEQRTVSAALPPRPPRTDGTFEPRIEVVGLVEWSE